MKKIYLALFTASLFFVGCSEKKGVEAEPLLENGEIAVEFGGPNLPNQVYVDLSTGETTVVKRDIWDLGFHSGRESRVILNTSMFMSAGKIESTNIDEVNSNTTEVKDLQAKIVVGTGAFGTGVYADPVTGAFTEDKNPSGSAKETAIAKIEDTDADNKVYLLNLGEKISTNKPEKGTIDTFGESRGWKKIRILKKGDGYLLQYADLDAADHKEVTITKNTDYNFSFFSFTSEKEVMVEPKKDKWDINFTTFTNANFFGLVRFGEFVLTNRRGDVQSYNLNGTPDTFKYSGFNYDEFSLNKLESDRFKDNYGTIGNNWFNYPLDTLADGFFFAVKDTDDNVYKIKFTAVTNQAGERGYPVFEYSLLK